MNNTTKLENYNDISYSIRINCDPQDIIEIDNIIGNDNIAFILFEQGKGFHAINQQKFEVRERQVHIIFPKQNNIIKLSEPSLFHVILISKQKYLNIIGGVQIQSYLYKTCPVFDISNETYMILLKEYKEIYFEIFEHSSATQEIVNLKTKIIVTIIHREIKRISENIQIANTHPELLIFIDLIKKYLKETRQVSFYANLLGITPNYLNILCKKHFKKTASNVIGNIAISVITKEVRSNSILIDIAYDYNFQSYLQFFRFFKKYTGQSPTAYKNKHPE